MFKVLIIDDEENFCALVKKNVEKTGEFRVSIATNGEDGVKAAHEIQPDLILLDIVMPDMDGGDVLARIRKDPSIEATPIVFLTALIREQENSAQMSFTTGYAMLSKTATVQELLACIRENVRRYPRA